MSLCMNRFVWEEETSKEIYRGEKVPGKRQGPEISMLHNQEWVLLGLPDPMALCLNSIKKKCWLPKVRNWLSPRKELAPELWCQVKWVGMERGAEPHSQLHSHRNHKENKHVCFAGCYWKLEWSGMAPQHKYQSRMQGAGIPGQW